MRNLAMRPSSALKKTRECSLSLLTCVMMGALVCSCSDRIHVIPDEAVPKPKPNVRISVNTIEQIPFGGTKSSVQDVCTKLTYALFTGVSDGGTREMQVTQKLGVDSVFGTIQLNLSVGRHYLAVIGEKGGEGTPSVALNDPTKDLPYTVRFKSENKSGPKVVDTFHYFAEIEVLPGENDYAIDLSRSVAMFRLKLTNPVPSQVTKLRFDFNNGSNSLDLISGKGCVKMSKGDYVDMTADPGKTEFEVYTFPYLDKDKMKMTVTAYDKYNNNLAELALDNVPLTVNRISQYTGDLFKDGCKEYAQGGFPIQINDEWDGIDPGTF